VFNGEIYNYKELIKSENLSCVTASDSEVLIRLYQKYGVQFLNLLKILHLKYFLQIKALKILKVFFL